MKELFDIARGFQTSVNIAYDLNNDDKVRAFIPTLSSLDVMESVILSTADSTALQRAHILIGAYGRGKSHIVLILLSLLHKKDKSLFESLLSKMKKVNPALYVFASEYLDSKKKILPVVIRGSNTSLTQSFLAALEQTLREEGLADLMPDTHFQAALNQIDSWKRDYPKTYKKFCEAINNQIEDYKLRLRDFDVGAYDEFVRVYPALTAGSAFNPFLGFDVVDLYEATATKLKTKGYSGLFVVYDEFSKYLESSIAIATNSDIKLLQDFAEKCDRSGSTQMHLMLISHKDISNYIDGSLPKDKVDGWRGVSGRFRHITLHNNFVQMYEIISAVIRKKPTAWRQFLKANKHRFESMKMHYARTGLLDVNDSIELKAAVIDCYPMHPLSTFILPRLSERVAQNERTLFTFLSADDKHTLTAFIESAGGDFPLLTPDYLYDYFEPLFRKEPYTSDIHKMYLRASGALRRVGRKSLHSKIIKTIALIYLVEQFERLAPTMDVISDVYRDMVDDPQEIATTLKELQDSDCVVYQKRSNHYLKIKQTSGVDVQETIRNQREQRFSDKPTVALLNATSCDSYLYPTAYNDENEIVRYFDFLFIDAADVLDGDAWKNHVSEKADGTVFGILTSCQAQVARLAATLDSRHQERVVFIAPAKHGNIRDDVLDYAAVCDLFIETDDEILRDEYSIYMDDLAEVVRSFIAGYVQPEAGSAQYYYKGQKQLLHRRSQLTGLLSYICSEVYSKTPVINNESINKNELTSTAFNSRTKILTGLLAGELAVNIGLTGTGQDVSIMRSTLIQTGILYDVDAAPRLELEPADAKIRGMLAVITSFFNEKASAADGADFAELYDTLIAPEHGFGLRRSLIPIYIAVVMHGSKNNLVIRYVGREVKITPEVLNSINERPQDFSCQLEDWNDDKVRYMVRLEEAFAEFVDEREKAYNHFTYLLLAMKRWYLSLPKYAKEMQSGFDAQGNTRQIESEKKKLLRCLAQTDINPRQFFFESIIEFFGDGTFKILVADHVLETKRVYDTALDNLIVHLNVEVKQLFSKGKSAASLLSLLKDWLEKLSPQARQTLYPGAENRVLSLIAKAGNDERTFIQSLAKVISTLRLDDWNDYMVAQFLKDIKAFKETIDAFDKEKADSTTEVNFYEIIFTDATGQKTPRRFTKMEYGKKAKLLRAEIATALEEMGQSISEQEKRQVLVEFLEKMC